jgi:Right handed beta helix region
VSAARPRHNFGAKRLLTLDAAPIKRAYVRFNLRTLVGTISSATLRFYAFTQSRKGYAVHVGGTRWRESSLTYSNAPRFSGVRGRSGQIHPRAWTSVDVTGLAQTGKTLNLVLTTRARRGLRLASREYAGRRPRLVVSMAPPVSSGGGCSGATTDVYAGGDIAAAVNSAHAGDSILVHAGTYPKQALSKAFAAKTCVAAAAGDFVTVHGFDLSGAANLDISGFDVAASPPDWGFRLGAGAEDIGIHDNLIHGGDYGVKFYAPLTWPRNIVVRDNDISHALLDDVHVDGAESIAIQHNFIHDVDLTTNTKEHHDGIQVISGTDVRIAQNTIAMTTSRSVDGANQGIIVGHRDPLPSNRRVSNVVIASNLVNHWAGKGVVLAGVNGAKIVNNTVYDNGDGNLKTNQFLMSSKNDANDYQNSSVEIWNNIFGKMWRGEGSTAPVFCGYNLIWPSSTDRCDTVGELAMDPLFADHDAYRLQQASPALDSGSSRAGTPTDDISGLPYGTPDRGARRD